MANDGPPVTQMHVNNSQNAIGSVGVLNMHHNTLQSTVQNYYQAIARQRSLHTVVEVNATDNDSPDHPRADQIYVPPDVWVAERREPSHTTKSFAVDKLTAVELSGPKCLPLQSCLSSNEATFQRVVLTATSGMGKTTAVNRWVLTLASSNALPWMALHLPSLLGTTTQADQKVQSALQIDITQTLQCSAEQAAQIANEVIRKLDEKPGVMLFDALDEVPSTQRTLVLNALRLFIAERRAAQPAHRIVVTSRPYAYNGELEHEGFSVLALAPLTPLQVDALIDQYFSRVVNRPEVGAAMKSQVASARSSLSQKDYVDLLEEPMLATYACMLASENSRARSATSASPESLPSTRFELFDGVVRLLLEKWEPTRADTKFAPLKPLFESSAGQRSPLRAMLERAAYGQFAELSEHAVVELKPPPALTHERLVAIADELMPPTLPVRAYEVVRWLAERTAFLPALSEHPTKRYQLHLQLGSFLAAGGLYAKVGNDHDAYAEALVVDLIRAPESLRQFVTMGLAKICTHRRALVTAIECLLDRTKAMPDTHFWETVGSFAIAFTDAVPPLMWLSQDGKALNQALEPLRTQLFKLVNKQQLKAADRNRVADALATLGDPRFEAAAPHLMRHRYHDSPEDEPIPGFVRIPAGTFSMFDKDGRVSGPYQGTIKAPFYIARSLTTVQQYERFVNGGGYSAGVELWDAQGLAWRNAVFTSKVEAEVYKSWLARRPAPLRAQPRLWSAQLAHPSRPVTGVCWFEARAYARWLDRQLTAAQRALLSAQNNNDSYEVRLPTELQWERAIRASSLTATHEHRYPWGNDKGRIAQLAYLRPTDMGAEIEHVSSVGVFLPNAIGLYDMASWAWQWMDNLQENSASSAHPNIEKDHAFATDEDENKCERPALCGGSWFSSLLAYSHYRDRMLPGGDEWRVGFRVVLSQTQ